MKKLFFALLLLISTSLFGQSYFDVSDLDSIITHDTTTIFPIQIKTGGQYRWRKMYIDDLKDILALMVDSVSVSADWDSLSNRPTMFDTPTDSGIYISNSHLGYYKSGQWRTYIDSAGNFVLGNIGIGGNGLSWNQGTGVLNIAGSIDVTNLQTIIDSVQANLTGSGNVTIYTGAEPTERPDHTALQEGDTWIDIYTYNKRYIWYGGDWVSATDLNGQWDYINNKPSFITTPSGAGLYMGSGHMGYYNGSSWKSYIDSTGKFYFYGNATNYISWNGSVLTIYGSMTISNPTTAFNGGKLKGSEIVNDLGWGAGGSSGIATYYQSSAPTAPNTGDLWFDTVNYLLKRYNGSTWVAVGANGTYIDGTGTYTGTVAAQNIVAGSGIVANLAVLSTLTVGASGTSGIIKSYGWDGTANGFYIRGGSSPTISLIGGSISGDTIRSSTTMTYARGTAGTEAGYWIGKYGSADYRFFIGNSSTYLKYDNTYLSLYGANITAGSFITNTSYPVTTISGSSISWAAGVGAGSWQKISSDGTTLTFSSSNNNPTVTISLAGLLSAQSLFATSTTFGASNQFTINTSGQITKVNNVSPTSGYALIGDGTSFTPTNLFGGTNTWSAINIFSNEIRRTGTLSISSSGSVSCAGYNAVRVMTTTGTYTATLTGMTAGQTLYITNYSGSYAVTICGVSLAAGKCMWAWYDTVSSAWRTLIGN